MSSKVKLKELLKTKKPGDEWYSLHAPEEVRMWVSTKPWKKGTFSKRGVRLLAVSFNSWSEGASNKETFTFKAPLNLKCGVELTGNYKTRQTVSANLKCRVDDVVEFNAVMKELSSKTSMHTWEINKINVYNPKESVEIEFSIHNPDSNGSGLYLYRVIREKTSTIYPNIALSDQMRYVDKFYENLAHCTANQVTEMVHACGLEKKIPKKQIIRR